MNNERISKRKDVCLERRNQTDFNLSNLLAQDFGSDARRATDEERSILRYVSTERRSSNKAGESKDK